MPDPTLTPTEDTLPSTPDAEQPEASTEPASTSAPAQPEWWAALSAADKREIAKHPVVSGLVGTTAERQTQKALEKARAEWQAEQAKAERERATKAEQERLLAIAREEQNFSRTADEFVKKSELDQQQQEAARQAQVRDLALLEDFRRNGEQVVKDLGLTDEDLKDLKSKVYEGSTAQGFAAFLRDVNQLATKKAKDTAMDKAREAEIRAAARAELLAEQNGGEPAPDVGSGTTPTGKPKGLAAVASMSQKTYEQLGKTPQERWAALVGSR